MSSDDDLVECYLEISKMILLSKLADHEHQNFRLFTEEEFEVLRKTVRRAKDRDFKRRIEGAVDRCYAFQRAIDRHGSKEVQGALNSLEDGDLEVFPCQPPQKAVPSV